MTIQLKPEQERIIKEQMASGRYRSVDEVLDNALAILPGKPLSAAFTPAQLAGQRIRELRKGVKLGKEFTLKELIEEGRE